MSYSFVNKPTVSQDILEATEYYKTINPKLAKQFLYRLREAKVHIALNPLYF